MQITEIYSDADRETHFRNVDVELTLRDYAPPSAPVGISADVPVTSALFLEAPPGWDKSFHATPRLQCAILLSGRVTVTVSDGSTMNVAPGSAILLNDADSKGHLTQVQGNTPARFLLVGFAD